MAIASSGQPGPGVVTGTEQRHRHRLGEAEADHHLADAAGDRAARGVSEPGWADAGTARPMRS